MAMYVVTTSVNSANNVVNVHRKAARCIGMNAKHSPDANGNTLSNINIRLSDSSFLIETVATVIMEAFSSSIVGEPRNDSEGHLYRIVNRQLF